MKGIHDNESITTALDKFFRDEYGGEYSQGISRRNSGNDIGNSLGKTKPEPTGETTAGKSITGLSKGLKMQEEFKNKFPKLEVEETLKDMISYNLSAGNKELVKDLDKTYRETEKTKKNQQK